MDTNHTAANSFWRFSLAAYARPQVAELCLALQDKHYFDVNVVLFCLWLGQGSQTTLDQSEIRDLIALIMPLNENLVRPIRSARRWVRRFIDDRDPVSASEVVEFYAALKAVELEAERQVQLALTDHFRPKLVKVGTTPKSAASASLESYRQVIAASEAAAELLSRLVLKALAPGSMPNSGPAISPP